MECGVALQVQSHQRQCDTDNQKSRQKETPNSRPQADILETQLRLILDFGFGHVDSLEKGTPLGVGWKFNLSILKPYQNNGSTSTSDFRNSKLIIIVRNP